MFAYYPTSFFLQQIIYILNYAVRMHLKHDSQYCSIDFITYLLAVINTETAFSSFMLYNKIIHHKSCIQTCARSVQQMTQSLGRRLCFKTCCKHHCMNPGSVTWNCRRDSDDDVSGVGTSTDSCTCIDSVGS